MKRFIALLFIALCVISFTACYEGTQVNEFKVGDDVIEGFEIIEVLSSEIYCGHSYKLVDKNTGVIYLYQYQNIGHGQNSSMTILFDFDGKPLLDERYVK